MGRSSRAASPAVLALALLAGGCAAGPVSAPPTIGSPQPSATASATAEPRRSAELARRWKLEGVDLPEDWPDVPVPRSTRVTTAYAIGTQPRSWTASFSKDTGTALRLARPVAERLVEMDYTPISAYTGPEAGNAGLFSFLGPEYAVYLLLGEVDGRPNVVMTVRQRGPSDEPSPSGTASPSGSPVPTPTGTPQPSTPTAPSPTAPPSPTSTSPASPNATGTGAVTPATPASPSSPAPPTNP